MPPTWTALHRPSANSSSLATACFVVAIAYSWIVSGGLGRHDSRVPAPTTEPFPRSRRAVVVLGMHRSGTSAVAGCLHRLGVDFGPRLMPATGDNPRGYYEHIDIVNLHDRLLLALGGSWDETRPLPPDWWLDDTLTGSYRAELLNLLRRDLSTAPLWGLKDPRLCRLLPWWEPVWAATETQPLFVIVRRHPSEVAASLARREGFSTAKSHLLWLLHLVEAERWTRAGQRVFIDFQDFLADWQTALEPVRTALDQPWPGPAFPADSSAGLFVDPALSRSSASRNENPLPLWVGQASDAFQLGQAGRETEMRAVFDRISESLATAQNLYGASDAERSTDLRQQLETTRRQARWYEAEWHKACRRSEALQSKLTVRLARPMTGQPRCINTDISTSKLRNKKISSLRNIGVSLGDFLRKVTNFR